MPLYLPNFNPIGLSFIELQTFCALIFIDVKTLIFFITHCSPFRGMRISKIYSNYSKVLWEYIVKVTPFGKGKESEKAKKNDITPLYSPLHQVLEFCFFDSLVRSTFCDGIRDKSHSRLVLEWLS